MIAIGAGRRPIVLGTAVGLCAAALLGALSSLVGAARAQGRAVPTVVSVTMTDSKLKLAPGKVLVGSVVFRVVNKGKLGRDFRIAGKRTPRILAGRSTTLKVEFAKGGTYPYVSVGRRAARLSGMLRIVEPCTNPVASTVSVQVLEGPAKLSLTSVPCGTVTFVVTNVGRVAHSFWIANPDVSTTAAGGQGPTVRPGQTTTMTVQFTTKGTAVHYCNESEHDELYDESGNLSVV